MAKVTLNVREEDIDNIVKENLKEDYNVLTNSRWAIFDKDEDKVMAENIKNFIKFYMVPEEYEEWLKSIEGGEHG